MNRPSKSNPGPKAESLSNFTPPASVYGATSEAKRGLDPIEDILRNTQMIRNMPRSVLLFYIKKLLDRVRELESERLESKLNGLAKQGHQ